MYFGGEHRTRPRQVIGYHKKVDRDELLRRTAEDQRRRNELRRHGESARKIQSGIRTFLTRSQLRHQLDAELSSNSKSQQLDLSPLLRLIRATNILHPTSSSHMKSVVELSQNLIRNASLAIKECENDRLRKTTDRNWTAYSVAKFCANSLRICSESSGEITSAQINPVLRVAEILTDAGQVSVDVLVEICGVLVQRYYFRSVLLILHAKSLNLNLSPSSKAPTELHASLLQLLIRPLQVLLKNNSAAKKEISVVNFCQEVLVHRPVPILSNYVIRALADPSQHLLPLPEFLAILSKSKIIASGIYFCHAILTMICGWSQRMLESSSGVLEVLDFALDGLFLQHDEEEVIIPTKIDDSDEEMEEMIEEEKSIVPNKFAADNLQEELRTEVSLMLESPQFVGLVLSSLDVHNPRSVESAAGICSTLILENKKEENHQQFNSMATLFYKFAFNMPFLRALWMRMMEYDMLGSFKHAENASFVFALKENKNWMKLYAVFARLLMCTMGTVYEDDFEGDSGFEFSLPQVIEIAANAREVTTGLVFVSYSKHPQEDAEYPHLMANLFTALVELIKELHDRDSRRQFCPEGFWVSPKLSTLVERTKKTNHQVPECIFDIFERRNPFKQFKDYSIFDRASLDEVRFNLILDQVPCLLPFHQRLSFVYLTLKAEKNNLRSEFDFLRDDAAVQVKVRREYIYEDAFADLSPEAAPNMKKSLRVTFQNLAGLDEAGVDGGGLFREFMYQSVRAGFDANRGLFRHNEDGDLYPNPEASILFPTTYRQHFFFLGRLLGKAIYESLLTELHFADFFLKKLLAKGGKHSPGNVDLHYLKSLDPVLFKGLLSLKYDAELVEKMDLDFSVTVGELGAPRTVDLKPNGRNVTVTKENVMEYIFLMADFKLNRQIRQHTLSFREGLNDVVPMQLLQIFNFKELQTLISGTEEPIDVRDWRRNTHYSSPYTDDHPTIQSFWRIVHSFTEPTKRNLLRFVTSCSRPPLLGFKDLPHKFSINPVSEEDRLPTASTCMNLLKLPNIADETKLREKLLYAIESGAGFELS